MIARPSLDLSVIGNGAIAALLDRFGNILWSCWPRIDGDPIFCALVDGDCPESGFFSISLDEEAEAEQAYLRNTAIVQTVLRGKSGASLRITDFAPRFRQYDRVFRPPMIVRRIEPLEGLCRIRIRCRPRMNYGASVAAPYAGSNHVRYVTEYGAVRITSDAPTTHIANETGFVLSNPMTLILHTDEVLADSVSDFGQKVYEHTADHWRNWVRSLNIPFEWQEQVIRAAITLQLCAFEDTGGIVAALTTSIPESRGTQRNWDYRYCWIRDAFHTVHALNRVGATLTMERFIDYVTNVIALERQPRLKPVYSIVPEIAFDEFEAPNLAGFHGHRPVRIGNAARHQIQHDVYGSVILAAAQMFFDERLPNKGDRALFQRLEPLGTSALNCALTPDAGIWEYRGRSSIHTHSAAMCWVACDRLSRIATRLGLQESAAHWRHSADGLRDAILARAWNDELGCFVGSLDGDQIDASVLLLHDLGIVSPCVGPPTVAFTSCTFWYVDALAAIGQVEEARRIFSGLLANVNHVGLLSEDLDPGTGELWGNFPQTYSMAGLIVSAMRLSKGWEEAR